MADHCAVFPDSGAIDAHNGAAGIALAIFCVELKQFRAGDITLSFCIFFVQVIGGNTVYDICPGNIDDIFIISHVAVVYVHDSLIFFSFRRVAVNCTTYIIDSNVLRSCAVVGIYIDRFSGRVECTTIKSHRGRAIGPDGVISIRGVECRILKGGRGITPIERLSIDGAVFNNGIIRTDKAEVVYFAGLKRHFLEGDRAGAVKTVIAVVLGTEFVRVRHGCTDAPGGFVGSLTDEGKVLALCVGAFIIERVFAFTKCNSRAALSRIDGFLQGWICRFTDPRLRSNFRAFRVCSRRKQPQQHNAADAQAQELFSHASFHLCSSPTSVRFRLRHAEKHVLVRAAQSAD